MGARRINNERYRHHTTNLSLATIHKILVRNQVKPLKKKRREKTWNRYERPIPGERLQRDTCKIALGLYQNTALADCTRYMVVGLYPWRTASNTLDYLGKLFEEMHFPIQLILTDRGREFFAYKVQEYLGGRY